MVITISHLTPNETFPSCHPETWQGIISGLLFLQLLGFPTFVCAATAVSNLNSNETSLRYVEDSRDRTVSAAGIVIFLGLLTMLLEYVILSLRLVTEKSLNVFVVSIFSDKFMYESLQKSYILPKFQGIRLVTLIWK